MQHQKCIDDPESLVLEICCCLDQLDHHFAQMDDNLKELVATFGDESLIAEELQLTAKASRFGSDATVEESDPCTLRGC
jgi:hypothetical protein